MSNWFNSEALNAMAAKVQNFTSEALKDDEQDRQPVLPLNESLIQVLTFI